MPQGLQLVWQELSRVGYPTPCSSWATAHRDGPQPHPQRPQVDPHVQQVDQRVGAVGGVQHGALAVTASARLEGLGQQAGLQERAGWAAPAYNLRREMEAQT